MTRACNAIVLLLLASPQFHAGAAGNDPADVYDRLIDQYAATVVNVEYVLTVRFMGQSDSQDGVTTGVLIRPEGVVLLTLSLVQPDLSSRHFGDSNLEPPVFESGNFRVTMGEGGRNFDAALIALDRDLDLLWIRLDTEDAESFPYVDFSKSAEFATGQSVYVLDRMGPWFGSAPFVRSGVVAGETRIPRRLGILALDAHTGAVFDSAGGVLGLVVNPRDDAILSRGGWATAINRGDLTRPFLLPADLVHQANLQAVEAPGAVN